MAKLDMSGLWNQTNNASITEVCYKILVMRGSSIEQAPFAILRGFVACWYVYVLQVCTCLQLGLDHERGGLSSGASCPPSKSSGSKVHVQPTVTMA